MATGDQVNKTGIVIPVYKARFNTYPVLSGNCLDLDASGELVGPITFAWGTRYSVFFKANIHSTPNNAARLIDADATNSIQLSVTGMVVTHAGSQFSSGSNVIIVNEWHDYAIVFTGEHLRFYRDGVVIQCVYCATNPATTSLGYRLFNRGDGARNCDMEIAFFQWFNRGMEPEEVFAHLHSDALNKNNCELSYRFQEGTGTDLADTSGNARNTTLTNGTWATFDSDALGTNISTYDGCTLITTARG